MQIETSPEVLQFIHRRGGAVYLWDRKNPDSGQATRIASTRLPPADVDLVRYEGHGFDVYRESSIRPPRVLRLELRHWPRPRVVAHLDGVRVPERWRRRDLAAEGIELGAMVVGAGVASAAGDTNLAVVFGVVLAALVGALLVGRRSEPLLARVRQNLVVNRVRLLALAVIVVVLGVELLLRAR